MAVPQQQEQFHVPSITSSVCDVASQCHAVHVIIRAQSAGFSLTC